MSARILTPVVLVCLSLVASAGCGRITPSRRNLRTAVEAKRPELDACYAQTIGRQAGAQGGLVLWVEVDSDSGRVSNVEVERSEVPDEGLGQCVASTLQTIQIEPPPLAMRVHYTLQFQQEGMAGPAPAPPAVEGGQPPPPAVEGGQPPPPPAVGM